MATNNVKAVIVGGGPVGLFAAHSLRATDIDFVLLERRGSIIVDVSAALVLTPSTLRVFHQLGLAQQLLPLGHVMSSRQTFTMSGHLFNSTIYYYMRKKYVFCPRVDHSRRFSSVIAN